MITVYQCSVCGSQYSSEKEGGEKVARQKAFECENSNHEVHQYEVGQEFEHIHTGIRFVILQKLYEKRQGVAKAYYMTQWVDGSHKAKRNDNGINTSIEGGHLKKL